MRPIFVTRRAGRMSTAIGVVAIAATLLAGAAGDPHFMHGKIVVR